MLQLDIPGFRALQLEHIVLDYNGTIALDGKLLHGVAERLLELGKQFTIHVITADTFGSVHEQVEDLAGITVLQSNNHRAEKEAFVQQLGADRVIAFGNGRNDVAMLQTAAVGVSICHWEGAAAVTLQGADVICNNILDGLDLVRHPKRLLATLRA